MSFPIDDNVFYCLLVACEIIQADDLNKIRQLRRFWKYLCCCAVSSFQSQRIMTKSEKRWMRGLDELREHSPDS